MIQDEENTFSSSLPLLPRGGAGLVSPGAELKRGVAESSVLQGKLCPFCRTSATFIGSSSCVSAMQNICTAKPLVPSLCRRAKVLAGFSGCFLVWAYLFFLSWKKAKKKKSPKARTH